MQSESDISDIATAEPGTRLSRWHPYPAMVADDLALSIAAGTVRPGSRVLDPFCGSGRLLMAAAELGADCHGFDVNPLASLITEAKATNFQPGTISELARQAFIASRSMQGREPLRLRHSKVAWFSESVGVELSQIVEWLTNARLDRAATLIAGVALSAATRDAAWIRKSGWKLHRMDEANRTTHSVSAWKSFIRHLDWYEQHAGEKLLNGTVEVTLGSFSEYGRSNGNYDVILTSPPYGDSKTTVQYGAASSICLDVITRLPGLEHLQRLGAQIDRDCLGFGRNLHSIPLKPFWAGAAMSTAAQRVTSFLIDYKNVCRHFRGALKPGGTIVMIVGRRSTGGYRVRLDDFTVAIMEEFGLQNTSRVRRKFGGKRVPRIVNRFARAEDLTQRMKGRIKTMDEEHILTFTSTE